MLGASHPHSLGAIRTGQPRTRGVLIFCPLGGHLTAFPPPQNWEPIASCHLGWKLGSFR